MGVLIDLHIVPPSTAPVAAEIRNIEQVLQSTVQSATSVVANLAPQINNAVAALQTVVTSLPVVQPGLLPPDLSSTTPVAEAARPPALLPTLTNPLVEKVEATLQPILQTVSKAANGVVGATNLLPVQVTVPNAQVGLGLSLTGPAGATLLNLSLNLANLRPDLDLNVVGIHLPLTGIETIIDDVLDTVDTIVDDVVDIVDPLLPPGLPELPLPPTTNPPGVPPTLPPSFPPQTPPVGTPPTTGPIFVDPSAPSFGASSIPTGIVLPGTAVQARTDAGGAGGMAADAIGYADFLEVDRGETIRQGSEEVEIDYASGAAAVASPQLFAWLGWIVSLITGSLLSKPFWKRNNLADQLELWEKEARKGNDPDAEDESDKLLATPVNELQRARTAD